MAGPAELSDRPRMLVWITDEGDRCIEVNPSWLTWSGRSLDEACRHGWTSHLIADDRARVLREHHEHVGMRRPYATQFRFGRGDRAPRAMVAGAGPWFHQDGSFAGFAGACLDVDDIEAGRRSAHHIEAFHDAMMDALDEGLLVPGPSPDDSLRSTTVPSIRWAPLVGTGRGAALLRLTHHLDEHGLPSRQTEPMRRRATKTRRRGTVTTGNGQVALARLHLRPVLSPTDRLGHSAADDLFAVVARRVAETVRRGDAVSHLDEHTLAVLLDEVHDPATASHIVASIEEAVCQPVRLAGETYRPQLEVDLQVLPVDAAVAALSGQT